MGNLISFFKKVADGLRAEGNFGTAHVYRSTLNIVTTFHGSKYLDFHQVNPEWLKDFEVYLRSRGSSWNTVSTYLRVLRAVYNRAVDLRKAEYIPHLFRSVYTGTRTDRKRALEDEDMRKVFSRLSKSSTIPSDLRHTKELFILMFLLRGLPFVDLAYLRKSDLRGNVITYRRRDLQFCRRANRRIQRAVRIADPGSRRRPERSFRRISIHGVPVKNI